MGFQPIDYGAANARIIRTCGVAKVLGGPDLTVRQIRVVAAHNERTKNQGRRRALPKPPSPILHFDLCLSWLGIYHVPIDRVPSRFTSLPLSALTDREAVPLTTGRRTTVGNTPAHD
jgi:hypothetical protein